MSEAVSALNGATYHGFATVSDVGPSGMITLRGDLGNAKLKKAVKAATGVAVPARGAVDWAGENGSGNGVAWMSPDELLVLCDYSGVASVLAKLQKGLAGVHHLAANVSDARARFAVRGDNAREVLAKLSPADVAPQAFAVGQFRRSRLAQVAGAFWLADDETIEVICFRSVAKYTFDLLKTAALEGSVVGFWGDKDQSRAMRPS